MKRWNGGDPRCFGMSAERGGWDRVENQTPRQPQILTLRSPSSLVRFLCYIHIVTRSLIIPIPLLSGREDWARQIKSKTKTRAGVQTARVFSFKGSIEH